MWSVFLLYFILWFFPFPIFSPLKCFPTIYGSYLHTQLRTGKERPEDLLVVLPFSAASEEISAVCDSDPNRLELVRLYNEVKVP